jgi:serine protease DegQ
MRKLWLVFAQAVTLTLAVLFVVSLVKPDWLAWRAQQVVEVREAAPAPAGGLPITSGRPLSFSEAAKKAIPSVVNISATRTVQRRTPLLDDPAFQRFFGERFKLPDETQLSLGSGVIVSREGYILTNDHVVEGVTDIQVTLSDGRTLVGKVVGTDPETDLAVVRISAANLTAVTFGQSDQARVGDVVLAIGDPFSVGQTVTMGIVSAVGREIGTASPFGSFIQTDAAINPGNSGGALVDTAGNLIGINTLIFSRSGGYQGIGFAIPVSLAKRVLEQIIETGTVTRGWFGVEVADITPELAESLGAEGHARRDRRRHRARQPRREERHQAGRRDRERERQGGGQYQRHARRDRGDASGQIGPGARDPQEPGARPRRAGRQAPPTPEDRRVDAGGPTPAAPRRARPPPCGASRSPARRGSPPRRAGTSARRARSATPRRAA